jgi:hypothetical protein
VVQEGYAFLHLSNVGTILRTTPAGGIVKLASQSEFKQAWKLKAVKDVEAEAAKAKQTPIRNQNNGTDDLDLIVGVKGNSKLGDLFHDLKVATYEAVLQIPDEKILECLKGNKDERGSQLDKFKNSALALFGKG